MSEHETGEMKTMRSILAKFTFGRFSPSVTVFFVVLGGFIVQMIAWGTLYGNELYYRHAHTREDQLYRARLAQHQLLSAGISPAGGNNPGVTSHRTELSPSAINMLSIMGIGIANLLGSLTGTLADRTGYRIVIFIGGVIIGIGLLVASFVQAPVHVAVTHGIVVGLGTSMVHFATLAVPSQWVQTHYALATGVVMSGSDFGAILITNTTPTVVEHLGLSWALRATALVVTVVATFAAWSMQTRAVIKGHKQQQQQQQQQQKQQPAVTQSAPSTKGPVSDKVTPSESKESEHQRQLSSSSCSSSSASSCDSNACNRGLNQQQSVVKRDSAQSNANEKKSDSPKPHQHENHHYHQHGYKSQPRWKQLVTEPKFVWRCKGLQNCVLAERRFNALVISSALMAPGFMLTSKYLAAYVTVATRGTYSGPSTVDIISAASAIGRIALGYFADRYGRINALLLASTAATCASLGGWLDSSPSAAGLHVFAATFGASTGAYLSLLMSVVVEYFAVHSVATHTGYLATAASFGILLSPQLAQVFLPHLNTKQAFQDAQDARVLGYLVGLPLLGATLALLWIRVDIAKDTLHERCRMVSMNPSNHPYPYHHQHQHHNHNLRHRQNSLSKQRPPSV
ncbi:MFS general substrate transporter [Ramicandelaber brevisporus]|nr:MFS general substrate transporter [Ramicandelaber brevisporus]